MNKAEALTMNEFRQLRTAFRKEVVKSNHDEIAIRNRALIELLFTLTLRVSDLLNLKVHDIITEDGAIKTKIKVMEEKNKNLKGVRIRTKPKKAIKEWLETSNLDRDDYLFSSPYTNGSLSRQTANNIIKSQLDKVKLEEEKIVATHSGRKTMARRLYKNGENIETIRSILGHQDTKTTINYVGIFDKDRQNALKNLPD